MTGKLHVSKSPKEVASDFAQFLRATIQGESIFNIALSGGSTPKLLFKILAEDFKDSIEWSKVHFFWGDERCVDPSDKESNFKMTDELLFGPLSIPTENIHRVLGESDPEIEASRYSKEILKYVAMHNALPQFDLIMLGMGEDGHTASIFPQQMELLDVNRVCDVAVHPTSGQKRITITGKTLNNAKKVAFLLTGEGKKEKIDQIFNQKGNWLEYPAAHMLPVTGDLHWFLDEAALP